MAEAKNAENSKLKDILIKGNYLTAESLAQAESFAEKHRLALQEALLLEHRVTREILGQALAESLAVQYAHLNLSRLSPEQVLKIPEALARQYRVVLFAEKDGKLTVATDDPAQRGMAAALQEHFKGKEVVIAYSFSADIDEVLNFHYRKTLETKFAKILEGKKRVAPEIIDAIIGDALVLHASDIHFEPQEAEVIVRLRLDGVLHEAGKFAKNYYDAILNRIKIQAQLRIDEHFAAQDGAIRHNADGKSADLRVSIVPTLNGEKVVLRLLASYVDFFNLGDLGLSGEDEENLLRASKKPFGMILITGPTSSGKSTTLYTVIKLLNSPEVNITTIEDPVEYKLNGINQIQVNPQTNLTFAKGLRAIVRQDPNVILVGEIRDRETAEIAVNSALTGHLLLSTFHANDTSTAVPRLLEIGIEPFLLASTLDLVVAQRLLRKVCEHCRVSYVETGHEIEKLFPDFHKNFPDGRLYKGKGCLACGNTGYRGRTAVFEMIAVTPEMRELILKNPSAQQVAELAKTQGSRTLFEDGLARVKSGVTTIQDLLRVVGPPAAVKAGK